MHLQSRAISQQLQGDSNSRPLPLLSAAEVKSRVNLLAYVSKFVNLRKRGVNWFALCPFHKERHPSFAVRPDLGLWYCFGCGLGGDIFSFERHRTGCAFADAVRQVAQNAGLLSVCAADNADLIYELPSARRAKRGAYDGPTGGAGTLGPADGGRRRRPTSVHTKH